MTSITNTAPSHAEKTLLRHTLATVAYRGGKAVANAPDGFATFRAAPETRSPAQILAHIGDLFDWALSLAKGKQAWHDSELLPWHQEVERFHRTLQAFDDYLASDAPLSAPVTAMFQGPIADALTHVGQLAMLRRIAGAPIRAENYFRADIAAGRVGPQQSAPKQEF